jgi:hypothetical protein
MDQEPDSNNTHNISQVMVGVVILAIIIIATLTVTAIISGPPVV